MKFWGKRFLIIWYEMFLMMESYPKREGSKSYLRDAGKACQVVQHNHKYKIKG